MSIKSNPFRWTFICLLLLLLIMCVVSLRYGAVRISPDEMWSALRKIGSPASDCSLHEQIFLTIRLPRIVLGLIAGSALGVGGTLMQGLFRNPIVEPGLVGTSSGAAFGAAAYFVLGAWFHFQTGEWTLPLAACLGGLLSTILVFTLVKHRTQGTHSMFILLLTGIAINAFFLSGVGFLSYIARDPQARSIVFWNLGTLSGASWRNVLITGAITLICILFSLRMAKSLNALLLGEEDAYFMGVSPQRIRIKVMTINVMMVAVITAFTGVISFVGLVVPHILRFLHGPDHRYLIRNSVLLGGLFMISADFMARMLVRPAELPIGIVTSVVGVPVFILMLRQYFNNR